MATITECLDALAAQLKDLLQPPEGVDLHIEPRWFNIAETPAIDMNVTNSAGLEDGLAGFAGGDIYPAFPVAIRARVSPADLYTGEDLITSMIDDRGPMSIIAAIDADDTLGGVADCVKFPPNYPWDGLNALPEVNGNGFFIVSTMTVVIERGQS